MSTEQPITRENLVNCLKELAKEFLKLNGRSTPAEIILVGGASILINYGFREATYDVDAVIRASSAMKEASNRIADKLGLPNGWLNMDFKNTKSYSDKLDGVSVFYKTYSGILTIRTVAAEYLVAMKLMAGREYKNDLSDIAGILYEHQKSGKPIAREAVDNAVRTLYGNWDNIPPVSKTLFNDIFDSSNLEAIYQSIRESEKSAKAALLDFKREYPDAAGSEESIKKILELAKRKKNQ